MLEAVLSRAARPQGWGLGMGARSGASAFATSRSLEAGSGCISLVLHPQDYFSAFYVRSWTQWPSELKFTHAQFRNCLASLIPKPESWKRKLMGELGSHVYLFIQPVYD